VEGGGRAGGTRWATGGRKAPGGAQAVTDIGGAYEQEPLGPVTLTDLKEVPADRRLRLAIKPFLDADETRAQLANSDPAVRQGAAVKLGNQADLAAGPTIEEALKKETHPW